MAIFGDSMRQALTALRYRVGEHGPAPWTCPACGGAALHPSRAVSWIERVGRVMRMRVYRCHACQRRRWYLSVASAGELANRATVRNPARWHRKTPVRALVATAGLATALAGAVWVFAAHRSSFRAKGEQALSLGQAWWLGASNRLSLMATDLKLWTSPPQPAKTAASPPSAAPPRRQPPPAKGRRHAMAIGTAAPPRVESGVGGVAWRAARWGMTVEDVLGAFPGEAVRAQASVSERISVRAAIEHAVIGTHTYNVSFFFGRDGRLAAVQMSPDTRGQSAAHAYHELADWLSGELGPPASHDARSRPSGTWSETSSWTTPDSSISLRVAETVAQDARILAVDVRSGDVHAFAQGVTLSYEPVRPPYAPQRSAGARGAR